MKCGIQLYGVRDFTEKDFNSALAQLSQIGYASVELDEFYGNSPAAIAKMVSDNQLQITGTHTDWVNLVERLDEVIACHQELAVNHIVIPNASIWSSKTMEEFLLNANRIQDKLEECGISLAFHNHFKEFETMTDGFIPFEEILLHTRLNLEIDTYWAYVAGKDPVALMEKYCDRVQFIHLKDGDERGHGKPLGKGTAPVKNVYAKAIKLGIPVVVESETLTPDGMTEARICAEYLKQL